MPRRFEVRFDKVNGLVLPDRGISVSTRPDGLGRFGGAYEVVSVPPDLAVVQIGRDPHHFEIIPAHPMTLDDYTRLLRQIVLVRV